MTNHYATLGIRPSANPDEIKSAYRRAARDAHPDRRGDTARFRLIQDAYETLSDLERRARYDEARDEWMRQLGAVACHACGHANRITRRPTAHEVVRCWHCKTPLRLSFSGLLSAQRQSLVSEAARVVDEVGIDLADLASDAVRTGIARLRMRLGLAPKARLKT